MIVTLIAAMGRNRVIGGSGQMPWRLPREMRHFVRTTKGHPIIVGRKTFASWGSRSLPNRRNILLTTRSDPGVGPDVYVARSVEEALRLAEEGGEPEVFVCGGAVVYGAFLSRADRMVLTHIDAEFSGDTWFPQWDEGRWGIVREEVHLADADNVHDYAIRWYVRNLTEDSRTLLA